MHPISFIAKHIKAEITKNVEQCDTVCAFTGSSIKTGIKLKKLLGSNFTDTEYINNHSEHVSIDFAKCYSDVLQGSTKRLTGLRNYSFLCTENELRILKKDEFIDIMLDLPDPPFILAYSYNNKKHISYKSRINYSQKEYCICTDKDGNIKIDQDVFLELYPIMQSWYTHNPDIHGKNNTYFTKQEILYGSNNYKKIKQYGLKKYKHEDMILDRHRGSLYYTLITRLLNIKELQNAEY